MGSAGIALFVWAFFFNIILLKIHLNPFPTKPLCLRRCWGTGQGSAHPLKPREVSGVTGIPRQVGFGTVLGSSPAGWRCSAGGGARGPGFESVWFVWVGQMELCQPGNWPGSWQGGPQSCILISLGKGLSSIGTGCPGQRGSPQPWRGLKTRGMRNLGTWLNGGTGGCGSVLALAVQGERLDWMILRVFSNLNSSGILGLLSPEGKPKT